MTVQEIMERVGSKEPTLIMAYLKDAIHLIQSNTKEKIKVNKQNILNASDNDDNVYRLPADMIAIENVSILDTSDSRYKRIKRISSQPHYLLEDTSP